MKKSALLWTSIIILFLLNAGTLFFILNRPPHPGYLRNAGNREFDESVINTLQLNPDQIAQFNRMKREHHQQMLQLDDATRVPFEQYFGLLAASADQQYVKDSLEKIIAGLYIKRMQVTYRHFTDLKAICTPEQQQKFNLLVPSLTQVMSTGEKKEDHHRRKMY